MQMLGIGLLLQSSAVLAAGQPAESLELTLKLVQQHGYYAAKVDWPRISSEARARAQSKNEDSAIHYVLSALGDGHSFYRPPPPKTAMLLARKPSKALPVNSLSKLQQQIAAIAIISVHGWSGSGKAALDAAMALKSQVHQALTGRRCGIVLDFSANSGGNMWPMLSGLSPLLSEGLLGAFQDSSGKKNIIEKKAGSIFYKGHIASAQAVTFYQQHYPVLPIAVIVGAKTASSGEIVSILFDGQPNVRSFGQRTAGYATANTTYRLPNGGKAMITTAVTLNREGKVFERFMVPDTVTTEPLAAATSWLQESCHQSITNASK
jgi:C-terminal processing protease CtpA/Prc